MSRRVTVERRPVAVERVPGGYDPARDVPPAEVRAAVAAQLRLALVTVGVVGCVLVGLPVLVGLLPAGEEWFVLSVAVQPLWAALAYWHLRRAERLER
ncbi:hypothetical protein ACIBG8_17520 [Nonomuraea sp. NPDC050556]|uniref:hypothetical protein n=1 Tax=Nonomuraea sp. NPDC050556 TaxID=3364369 RepID=UPI0037BD5850